MGLDVWNRNKSANAINFDQIYFKLDFFLQSNSILPLLLPVLTLMVRVLFFDDDKPVKWCHCLLELEREMEIHGKQSNILFVVSKTNENHYGIKTPYKRCPFPDGWRGLHEQELEKASGI